VAAAQDEETMKLTAQVVAPSATNTNAATELQQVGHM